MQKEKPIVTKVTEKYKIILSFLTECNPSREGMEIDRRGQCKMCFCMDKNLLIVPGGAFNFLRKFLLNQSIIQFKVK